MVVDVESGKAIVSLVVDDVLKTTFPPAYAVFVADIEPPAAPCGQ